MKILASFLTLFFFAFLSSAQIDLAFFELDNSLNIDVTAKSNGTFKSINFTISNLSNQESIIHFPLGGLFINREESEQNLVVVDYDKITVPANTVKTIEIEVACANADKKAPRKNRTTWDYDYDSKLRELLLFYYENRTLIEYMTGSHNHDTQIKRHNFLQMCVWVYYGDDKQHITSFATTYIFDGDKDAAETFVDVFYPMVSIFLELYKNID